MSLTPNYLCGNCKTVRSKTCVEWWEEPGEEVTETFEAGTIYHPSQAMANCIALEFVEGRLDEAVSCADCCNKIYCLSSPDEDINEKILLASVNGGFLFSTPTELLITPVYTGCKPEYFFATPTIHDGGPPLAWPACADVDGLGCQWLIPEGRLISLRIGPFYMYQNPAFSLGYDCDLGCEPPLSPGTPTFPALLFFCPANASS